MKQARRLGFAALVLALAAIIAACSPSPKSQVSDFLKLMPEDIGEWEQDDKATVELRNSTITSQGHAALQYEGPNDEIAFVVIEAFPSEDSAQVAYATRERTLLLRGLEFESDRAPRQATAQITRDERVRYALLLEGVIMVEIDVLAPDAETEISDEAFDELLSTVRAVYAHLAEK